MKLISTDKVYDPIGPFSQALVVGNMVFTAGIGGLDKTGKAVSNDVEEQTVQCMENLKAVLEAAGVGFKDVVKAVVYLTNMKDYARVNAIYEKYMEGHRPARTCVAVKELPADELMKIEMIAVKPE